EFNEEALTAADAALVKSGWPITASGVIRPPWSTGRGNRRTRLFPASATYSVPSKGSSAIPLGDESDVLDGAVAPGVSTFATAVRIFGCPITRSAASPLRNRTASLHTRTRLFDASDT